MSGDDYTLDVGALIRRLREELRSELLEELRAERATAPWPEWMSVEMAARYLDFSEERVRKLKESRRIPFHQEGPGCRVFFRRTELDEWMRAFRHPVRGGDA